LSTYAFDPYTLDSADAVLSRGTEPIPLTPKAFAVLLHLVERRGHLVTKNELFDAVWAGVFVGDAVLKVCIREIRKALDDDPKVHRFIETVHRRGYRFVAPAVAPMPAKAAESAILDSHAEADTQRETSEALLQIRSTPDIHYARSGDVNIAYQVVGDGPLDLVLVMGWISHLEYFWAEPSFARFLRRLSSFSRLILFDKRGTGLSDRVAELPTLERRMEDVRAVLEAVGSHQAALVGISEGGPMCCLFAATHPDKTLALVMYGTYAKRTWDPAYPWAPTAEEREHFYREIREHWGGPVGLEERAPSVAADPRFRAWWAKYLRMGASPGAALALTRMNTEIDIRPLLPLIRVPTLILHRADDQCLKVEEGRYVGSRIPGARYVEFPGRDHLPFVGDQDALLDEIEEFLLGSRHTCALDRVLATVLSAWADRSAADDWSGRMLQYQAQIRREIDWFRGNCLHLSAEGFVATFDGPARAIRCACAVAAAGRHLGIDLHVGVHSGECDVTQNRLAGLAVEISDQISRRATAGEVLVSSTVRDLVAGAGLQFRSQGVLATSGDQGDWQLYTVDRSSAAGTTALFHTHAAGSQGY
jgi:DNA-binding winged helix-turn-helix (wHTH) protein/pimeloyl-ACP methyl ester carboxylesterase